MTVNSKTSFNKQYVYILSLSFISLFVLSLQGFDLCDEGFILTSFQQIFNSPENISYQFLYYLNGLVGGIFYQLNPNGGILFFRFLNILLIMSTLIVILKCLNDYLNPKILSFSIVFSILVSDFGTIVLHPNYLSAFLIICAVFLINNSIHFNSNFKAFLAGLFLGLSFFARLPNVSLLALSTLYLINYFFDRNFLRLIKLMASFFFGNIIIILIMLLIMNQIDHLSIYIKSIEENLLFGAIETNHNHSASIMFKNYFYHGLNVIKFLVKLLLIIAPIYFFINYFKNSHREVKLLGLIVVFLLFNYLAYVDDLLNFSSLLIIPIVISLLFENKNKPIVCLNLSALIIYFFMPIGSDGGAYNTGITSMWLIIFVGCIHLFNFYKLLKLENVDYHIYKFKINLKLILSIFVCVLMSFLPLRLIRIYDTAYFDFGQRHVPYC